MKYAPLLTLTIAALLACSSPRSPADAGDRDAATQDVNPVDATLGIDASMGTDVPAAMDVALHDVREDAATTDAAADTASDTATSCGAGETCRPFICACGRCNPDEIVCVSDGRVCPLACPIACPELETVTCRCEGSSCVRSIMPADAGGVTDAGSDARLDAGEACSSNDECGMGLLCCYPCGIPGCTNRCMAPEPGTMRCPLIP